ncbi:hypothetical protein M427DRAFT_49051 [Gonapodya prolifera JEL478]|uniref:Uncharacterized protein n=1 Tax=Gonapodya prolifera (strain JEL478) TaxID=1344416 RepID=A0A138ZZE3_GONPJ|nr:hypothetical protein M427DRAFT_49051 [Gonapodya prolifera JEL478]|eukprot:KXS09882.1 hypothetical protein M427DRAFT_49051 [Gonapodya prolifera JEL478]
MSTSNTELLCAGLAHLSRGIIVAFVLVWRVAMMCYYPRVLRHSESGLPGPGNLGRWQAWRFVPQELIAYRVRMCSQAKGGMGIEDVRYRQPFCCFCVICAMRGRVQKSMQAFRLKTTN